MKLFDFLLSRSAQFSSRFGWRARTLIALGALLVLCPVTAFSQTFTKSVDTGSGFSSSGTVDVGDIFTYRLQYSFPTTSGSFTNVVVTDVLPADVEFISLTDSVHIQSTNVSGQTVTFTFLSSDRAGSTGELLIRARFPNGTVTGTQADNNATMTGTGVNLPLSSTPADVTVTALNGSDPVGTSNGVQIVKSSDAGEVYLGSGFSYLIAHGSLGGEVVNSYTIEDTFPDEFIFEQWRHSQPFDANLTFTVNYKTSNNASFVAWPGGPFSTDDNNGPSARHGTDELTLAAGEFVTGLQFVFADDIPVGTDYVFATGAEINISGEITTLNSSGQPEDINGNTVTIGTTMSNTVTLDTSGQYATEASSIDTNIVADQAVYGLRKTITSPTGPAPFTPGEIVDVTIEVRSPPVNVEDLVNPTVWDLLPAELEYVGPISVSSFGASPVPSVPDFEATPNWDGTGRTLLKFSWDSSNPYTIQPNSNRTGALITFKAQIPFGLSDGNYTNEIAGTLESAHICQAPGQAEVDVNDFDGDSDRAEIFCGTRPARFEVFDDGSGVGLDSQKWVKGECDTVFSRFPNFGSTVPGGVADYELRILNPSAVAVGEIDVIDILPFVGDGGVVDTSPRGSEWRPVLAGPVVPPASLPAGITSVTIYYSTSSNPDRTNLGITVPGADDLATTNWTTTPPADITTVRSLRFDIDGILAPTETLVFGWPMRAPLDAPTNGEIAWNSFGFAATNDDTSSRLLATEPVKVGFTTKPQSPARYGDYVWFDTNRNGIQEPSETGINGVRVELYSPAGGTPDPDNDTLVGFTVTQNDGTDDGAYIFSELAAGNYYAVFYPPAGFTVSSADQGSDDALDSDGSPGTVGVTSVQITAITNLGAVDTDLTWDQGFYDPTNGIALGDYVWVDGNNDGVQQSSESGISGVTVKLIEVSSGNTIGSVVTSDDGLYLFGGPNNDNLVVTNNTTPGSQNILINAGDDDALQPAAGGAPLVNSGTGPSNDLDLGQRDVGGGGAAGDEVAGMAGDTTVGLRFNGVNIPPGATITSAFIQFSANEVAGMSAARERRLNGGAVPPVIDLTIYGEDADNPGTFAGVPTGPATRTKTSQSVAWSSLPILPIWGDSLERGVDQRTEDLASIVQAIVDRGGWSSGNSMVFLIEGGGQREVESFDGAGNAADAPELILQWEVTTQVQNTITDGTPYRICIDTTQASLTNFDLISAGTADTSNNSATDTTDSDASPDGSDAVIDYTADAADPFNMSLDFGFEVSGSCTLDITSVSGANYNAATDNFDATVTVAYTGAPNQTVRFVIGGQTVTGTLTGAVGSSGSQTFTFTGVPIGTSVEAYFDGFQGDADKAETDNSLVTPQVGIGNQVWNDGNNNALFDAGEDTISGLTMELWIDLDGDKIAEPQGDDAAQTPLTTTTSGTGTYGFGGLIPGGYFVRIPTPPPAIPLSSIPSSGPDDGVDNDDNGDQPGGPGTQVLSPVVILTPGGEPGGTGSGNIDNTIDFGLVDPFIGNLIWYDRNGDGLVAASTDQLTGEPGISGVVIDIYQDTDASGVIDGTEGNTPFRTTVSNSLGYYAVGDLVPGFGYQVVIPASNFLTDGALEHFPLSSIPTSTLDDQIDEDDNGSQPGGAGTIVTGPVVFLAVDDEPVDGVGANDESGRGADLDNTDDDNGDLTVDFGFLDCGIQITSSTASNYRFDGGQWVYDLSVSVLYTFAPETTVRINGQDFTIAGAVTSSASETFALTGIPASATVTAEFPNFSTGSSGKVDNAEVLPPAGVTCTGSDLGGVVFRDWDVDGIQDSNELGFGVAGMRAVAYDASNAIVGSSPISIDGTYLISGLTPPVRLEFQGIPSYLQAGTTATNSGTEVQFHSTLNCDADLALQNPAELCDTDPRVVTSCFEKGSGNGANASNAAFVSYPYSSIRTSPVPRDDATIAQLGTVWGVAYQESTQRVFTSTFLKRHAALANDLSDVYLLDYSNAASASLLGSFDLQGIVPANGGAAIDVGSITRSTTAGAISAGVAGDNQLSDDPTEATRDLDAFAKIGAVGYGDIDLEEDGNTLWLVNLNTAQQSLISVDVSDSAVLPPAAGATVNRYLLSDIPGLPACTGGVFRPWALKFHNGRGYLGGVCSAEISQSRDDMFAYILSFDPASPLSGFRTEFVFALDYTREQASNFGGHQEPGDWQPWAQTWDQLLVDTTQSGNRIESHSPILSDIEFTDDGSMVLGFMDRLGNQAGAEEYPAISGDSGSLWVIEPAGDIINICRVNGQWVLENTDPSCTITDLNDDAPVIGLTNDGPSNNGEYYFRDVFDFGGNRGHMETTTGALAALPGSGEIMTTAFDPDNAGFLVRTGGTIVFDITNADVKRAYNIYLESDGDNFQKANGLGDIELICATPDIVVGNRVWCDNNNNGVQDPGEPGLGGVTVTLSDGMTSVTAVTASVDDPATPGNDIGTYYFSSAAGGNAENLLDFDSSFTISVNTADASLSGKTISTGTAATNDEHDSDADASGEVSFTTGQPGDNDYSFDIGVVPALDYGDAPDTYLTTNSAGGANHPIVTNLKLGATIDDEADGVPSAAADGDGSDEDGVTFPSGTAIMRTDTDFCANVIAMTPAGVTMATPVEDDFDSNSFAGGSGWTAGWAESPENNGAGAGQVQVSGGELLLRNNGRSISRQFTVAAGATSYNLKFDAQYLAGANGSSGSLDVEINGSSVGTVAQNGGTLQNIDLDITAAVSAGGTFTLRFDTDAMSSAENDNGFDIDNLNIMTTSGSAPADSILVAWLDLDQSGTFEAGEAQILTTVGSTLVADGATANKVTWPVNSATLGSGGSTYARFRYSTDTALTALTPGGAVNDGEVEDYLITIEVAPEYDYGDLPEGGSKDFPTAGAGAGDRPRHQLGTGLALGTAVDSEDDGQPNTTATGDGADEDGFTSLPDLVPGQSYSIPFNVTVGTATGPYYLNAWIDYNCNGSLLDGGEQIATGLVVVSGNNTLTFTVPADATPGASFARFRLSTTETLTPTGDASDGEVEDYLLTILAPQGAIGNYVWLDEDSNGLQDAGEPGIPNAKVELLLDDDGVGGPNLPSVIATTYTDANGGYLFDELSAGCYYVRVCDGTESRANTLPAGFTQTTPPTNSGADFGNQTQTGSGYKIDLASGDVNLTADFGYNVNPTDEVNSPGLNDVAALGDRVWVDADQDGVQDPAEIGISGVVLQICTAGPDGLFGTADDVAGTTQTTDANGNYYFDGLAPGAYVVKVLASNFAGGGALENYTQFGDPDHFATTGVNDNQTTAPVLLGPGDAFLNVDFGYDNDAALGSIGDRVWLDTDGSGTATEGDKGATGGEPGISGVSVALIDDTNGDGLWDPDGVDDTPGNSDDEPVIGTVYTDSSGCYLFDGLPAGDYVVVITDTDNKLGGLNQTYDGSGPLDDASGVTLTAGEDNITQDFSYTPRPNLGSIGDTVWLDLDGSGMSQATQGLEPGIADVTVTLTNSSGVLVGTTTTDANGNYLFSDLPFGTYTVTVTPPSGFTQTYDQDAPITDNASSTTITSTSPHDREQDFSYTPDTVTVGSVGDKVWVDSTGTGSAGDATQDATEYGLAGVTVTLTPPSGVDAGNGVDQPVITTTDENGCYLFTNLPLTPAVPYTVTITPPAGFTNDFDSNGGNDGTSTVIVDATTPNPRDQDFSLDSASSLVAIGSTLWFDADSDSDRTEDPGADGSAGTREAPLSGVRVNLLDGSGGLLATTLTDENGEYLFPNLSSGADYMVQVDTSTLPDGVSSVSTYESDATGGGGDSKTTLVNVTADNLAQDFSYPPLGGLGDKVFFDANNNNLPDPGEGIPGVEVQLLASVSGVTGNVLANTVTDSNGCYYFPNLPAGEYKVSVDPNSNTLPPGVSNTVDPAETEPGEVDLDGMSVEVIAAGETDLDQDFGYNAPGVGSIGTLVWEDHNADGATTGPDGPDATASTDDDEPSIPGVKVDLYWDKDRDGVRDFDDPQLGSVFTSAGTTNTDNYLFSNLPIDDDETGPNTDMRYIVHVSDCDGVLAGYWHSLGDQSVTTNNSSKEDDYAVTLSGAPNNDVATVDFGYYKDLAKLGNYVWLDAGADGIQEAGTGIANVELTLTVTYDTGDTFSVKTLTDANGNYNFCNLLADEDYNTGGGANPDFTISVTPPSGFRSTTADAGSSGTQDFLDSDASGVTAVPVQGLEDTAQLAMAENELAIASYDFGVVKAGAYADYLVSNAALLGLDDNTTGGSPTPGVPAIDPLTGLPNATVVDVDTDDMAALSDNIDGDIFNNLLEFALCFDPGSGAKTFPSGELNQGFHLELTGGVLDAKFTQPTGITGVTYTIQSSTDGQNWGNEVVIVSGLPLPSGVTSTPGAVVSGTTVVCFDDLLTAVGSDALLRLQVSAGSGGGAATGVTTPVGYQMATIKDFCQTYSDPLLNPCLVTGIISDATTATRKLTLTQAAGTQDLTNVLTAGPSYYVEITSGDNVGHIFDIESVDPDCVILVDDSDLCAPSAPYSTQTTVPANLAGDTFVIRAHKTLTSLFPIDDPATAGTVEGFKTGADGGEAGEILRLNRATGGIESFFAATNETWVTVSGGPGAPDQIIPPGEAVFTHNQLGEADLPIMQFGEVRTNQLAVPLKAGYNFVASAHPVVSQSIDSGATHSRQLNADNAGGKFTFTGSTARSQADQVQIWRDDQSATAAEAHLCYDAVYYLFSSGALDQWSNTTGLATERENEANFFLPNRGMIYCLNNGVDILNYFIPSPIINP